MSHTAPGPVLSDREALVRRGRVLEYWTVGYNSIEGVIAVSAGLFAASSALLGFGLDSAIEVISGFTLIWRLRMDSDVARREMVEQRALRIVGSSFLLLAAYVLYDSLAALIGRQRPEESVIGIVLATLSLLIMPLLVRGKRRVAVAIGSRALSADAMQTQLCTWLSAILLAGLLLNAVLGWWWADPVAALVMVPIIAKEGFEGLRGKQCVDGSCS